MRAWGMFVFIWHIVRTSFNLKGETLGSSFAEEDPSAAKSTEQLTKAMATAQPIPVKSFLGMKSCKYRITRIKNITFFQ